MDNRDDEFILQQMIRDGTEDEENASHDTDVYLNLEGEDIVPPGNVNEDTGTPENANKDTGAPNDQSASSSKMKSKRRGPTGWKNFKGRFIIEEVGGDGQPLGPPKAAIKFVNYRGYLVRDHVPINFRTWRPSFTDDPHVVPKAQKAMLWDSVKQKFNIPQEHEKKSHSFRIHKKILYAAFKKHGKQKGITQVMHGWPECLKRWYYAHHGTLAKYGSLKMVEAIEKSARGEFIPDREKDELTLVLQNPEHPGCTRGYGNYRGKARVCNLENELAETKAYIPREVARQVVIAMDSIRMQGLLPPPPTDMLSPKHLGRTRVYGSSCASTELSNQQYPMDEIQHRMRCELHMPVMNLTTRVAYGMASAPLPDQRYHGEGIPEGYSVVSVDVVCEGFGDLELPILGGGAPSPAGSPHGNPSPPKKIPSPPCRNPSTPSRRSPSPLPPCSSKNAPPNKAPSSAPPQPMGQRRSWSKGVPEANIQEEHSFEKTPIDPATKPFFVNMSKGVKRQLVSDFDRTVMKSCAQKHHKKNDEPIQLGQQPQGTLEMPREYLERMAKEADLTEEQLLGHEEPGKALVRPDLVKDQPTQMRRFHAWYMKKSATDPHHLIVVCVKEEDYFNGVDIFYLDFKDIYEIYHRGALNISLVSCWVLMKIQMCRKEGIYDVGFIDPVVINQKTILDHRESCFRQSQGTNVCGYYVSEFMHNCVTQRDMRMLKTRDELLPEDKIKVVQEGLIGFINREIILDTGEFYDIGEALPPPPNYVSSE
ncbi:hypothetical protein BS78_05G196800 [Paspalum vaginatum]|nr:hypothetical protein BS78_05G196800 [Paspalum vaginatum]